jgi:hypothetical protein
MDYKTARSIFQAADKDPRVRVVALERRLAGSGDLYSENEPTKEYVVRILDPLPTTTDDFPMLVELSDAHDASFSLDGEQGVVFT